MKSDFKEGPAAVSPDYVRRMAEKVANHRVASTGYVSDLGTLDLAPFGEKTELYNTIPVWGSLLLKYNSHLYIPHRARTERTHGWVYVYETDGRTRNWGEPVQTIDPSNLRFVSEKEAGKVLPSGYVISNHDLWRTDPSGKQLDEKELQELLEEVGSGKPSIISSRSFLKIPAEFAGKNVMVFRFGLLTTSGVLIDSFIEDGVVVDRDQKRLIPRMMTKPFSVC